MGKEAVLQHSHPEERLHDCHSLRGGGGGEAKALSSLLGSADIIGDGECLPTE